MQGKILEIEQTANETKKAFSLWLSGGMKKAKKSDSKLADYLGVERSTVTNWRRGKSAPRHLYETASRISEYLDIEPFVSSEEENTITLIAESPTAKALVSTIISIRRKNLLTEFVKFVSDKRFIDFLRDCKKLDTALHYESEKPSKRNHDLNERPLCFPITGERMTDEDASEILANHAAKNLYPLILDMFKLNPLD